MINNSEGRSINVFRKVILKSSRAVEIAISRIFLSYFTQILMKFLLRSNHPPDGIKSAVVAHIYYPEFLKEALEVQSKLPEGSPLLITVPFDKSESIRELTRGMKYIEINEVENRGRDIAPFLKLLAERKLDRFDAVLKIHSKKSPHLRHGDLRRRVFLAGLSGSTGNVARVLQHFREPRVGFVGLSAYFRTHSLYWMKNKARVEALCRTMGIVPEVGFFEGSMFWVRPKALERLRHLELRPQDFDAEEGQLDGMLHHAIERCFVISGLAVGYETWSVAGRRLRPD